MSQVQAILFDKTKWTFDDASLFLYDHNVEPIKMHETQNFYRFRLKTPNKKYKYRIKTISPGIKFVFEFK
jgi:hypothetical protein